MPLSLPCSICGKQETSEVEGTLGEEQSAIWDGKESHIGCTDGCIEVVRANLHNDALLRMLGAAIVKK